MFKDNSDFEIAVFPFKTHIDKEENDWNYRVGEGREIGWLCEPR